jgi:pyridoxal biosynthesis lyase PdxS
MVAAIVETVLLWAAAVIALDYDPADPRRAGRCSRSSG